MRKIKNGIGKAYFAFATDKKEGKEVEMDKKTEGKEVEIRRQTRLLRHRKANTLIEMKYS